MASTQTPSITIFRGFKEPGNFTWSPYVNKLEARLRFDNVRYAIGAGMPRQAPKGKVPYIEISHPGAEKEVLADSTLIIKALCEAGTLSDLNSRLSKADRAHDLALRALLEDKMSFYNTWERWTQNYYTMRDHVLWAVPGPLRPLIGYLAHRSITTMLHGQGTSRFTPDEIGVFRREVWEGIAELALASQTKAQGQQDGPFWILGGAEPTEADATVFGFVASALLCTAGPDSQADVRSFPALVEYADRIRDRYFSDYEALPAAEKMEV
ncbi:hypothetical protein F4861DRAFT_541352 [Xylaria intraflava]|nr:hypothetical protein F4861DRAFT_541352 [Xylaria intraflava]